MQPTTLFERYYHANSFIHRLDPRLKVILTLLFVVSNLVLPDGAWLPFGAAWIFLLFIARLGRLSLRSLLRRSLLALPFAFAALTVLFSQPGQTLWTVTIWGRAATVSDAGVTRFLSILARSWLSIQIAVVLTATTSFPDLMHALRHLRVPVVLVAIISFMYRYLFVLADEATRMLRARAARSAAPAGGERGAGSILWRSRVAGGMVGQLFLRSYERSERVYQAMLARGYRGQLLTMNPHAMRREDWLAATIGISLLLAVQLAAGFYR